MIGALGRADAAGPTRNHGQNRVIAAGDSD